MASVLTNPAFAFTGHPGGGRPGNVTGGECEAVQRGGVLHANRLALYFPKRVGRARHPVAQRLRLAQAVPHILSHAGPSPLARASAWVVVDGVRASVLRSSS